MYFKIIHAREGRDKQICNESDRMNSKLSCNSSNMNYLLIVDCLSRDFQLVANDIADDPPIQKTHSWVELE
jgi:hypothetical protein